LIRGVRTTEFWITVATNVGVVAAASTGVLSPKYAAIASTVSVAAYNVARGLAKLNTPKT
jgi:hypothetical protein